MKVILYLVNVDWYFISHRLIIAEELKKVGYKVVVVAKDTGRSREITDKGIQFINLSFSRSGTNPIVEFITLFKIFMVFSCVKPDIIHNISLKPVIYGSIIANFVKIQSSINSISGLGYNFTEGRINFITKIMLRLMKYGFSNNSCFIFQNNDDYKELSELNVLSLDCKVYFIKGSGVNLLTFHPTSLPSFNRIKVVLPCRMLWDKGVNEYYEAACILRTNYFNKIQFVLAGKADIDNKSGISLDLLTRWEDGDYFKWIGHQEDMFEVYRNSHIVVLPSYREGMPKTLIEACAMGRAIITTDAIGCRECVDEGVNGFKVPVKDSKSLAIAIERLVNDPEKIIQMGKASRVKAESEFDINFVIKKHIEIYNQFK